MNIGSLYRVKKFYWLLFPTKEIATTVTRSPVEPMIRYEPIAAALCANYCSKQYNCEVTYFSPDSIVVFLENDGELKKVLTSEGRIGWTGFIESYNECFEEVKTK